MKRYLSASLIVLGLSGFVFGADYAKMSNEELVKENGKFDPKDTVSYFSEVSKRVSKMTREELKDFRLKLRESGYKNEENMLVKDWRSRNEMICQELSKAQSQDHFLGKMAKVYCKKNKKIKRYHSKER